MKKGEELILVPKYEEYMKYMLEVLVKLPRVEKFSIGTEYKQSMYETIKEIIQFIRIEKNKREKMHQIDTELIIQSFMYMSQKKKNRKSKIFR